MTRWKLTFAVLCESIADCQARRATTDNDIVVFGGELLRSGEYLDVFGMLGWPR